jgi:hypothetical protein
MSRPPLASVILVEPPTKEAEDQSDVIARLAELRQGTIALPRQSVAEATTTMPAPSSPKIDGEKATAPTSMPGLICAPALQIDSDTGSVRTMATIPAPNLLVVPPIPVLGSIRFSTDFADDAHSLEHVNSHSLRPAHCGCRTGWQALIKETPWSKDTAAHVTQHYEAVLSRFHLRQEVIGLGLDRRESREQQAFNLWQVPSLERALMALINAVPAEALAASHTMNTSFWTAAAFKHTILNMLVVGNAALMDDKSKIERFLALTIGAVEHDQGGIVCLPMAALYFLAPRMGEFLSAQVLSTPEPNVELDLDTCRRHVLVRSLRPIKAGEVLCARLMPGRLWPFHIHMQTLHWSAGVGGKPVPPLIFDAAVDLLDRLFKQLKAMTAFPLAAQDADSWVLHGIDALLRLKHAMPQLNAAALARLKKLLRSYNPAHHGPRAMTHLQDAFVALLTALQAKLLVLQ